MPIAVIGSGRSGTSMLTGMLVRCGLYVGEGEDLIAPDRHNPGGYWEHRRMRRITDRIITHLTERYSSPALAPAGWHEERSLDGLYDEARRLVDESFRSQSVWGWKYPQNSLVIPFWRKVVPDLRFVLCMRNPLDAISSLTASFGYARSHAGERWMLHVLKALFETDANERFVTFYEEYFPNYREGLFPVLDFIGLPRPDAGSEIDRSLASFHNKGLNHYHSSAEALLTAPEISYLMRELYLEILAADRQATDLPILKEAEIYMPLLAKLFAAEEAEHQVRHLQKVLSSRTHRIASAICAVLISLRPKDGSRARITLPASFPRMTMRALPDKPSAPQANITIPPNANF